VRREVAFADRCLPLTAALVPHLEPVIAPVVASTPAGWHIVDRVVAVALPSLALDVKRLYAVGGMSMKRMFRVHQLEHLDREVLQLFCDRLEREVPGLMAALRAIAESQPR